MLKNIAVRVSLLPDTQVIPNGARHEYEIRVRCKSTLQHFVAPSMIKCATLQQSPWCELLVNMQVCYGLCIVKYVEHFLSFSS